MFFSVINIWGRKNALIFDISIFSDRKVNVVGAFGRLTSKIPVVSEGVRKTKKSEKMVIITRNQFLKNQLNFFDATQK